MHGCIDGYARTCAYKGVWVWGLNFNLQNPKPGILCTRKNKEGKVESKPASLGYRNLK